MVLQIATEGFRPEGLLSESMYSTVHKAEGPNGERWAVKCAKEVSLQGEHLFRNEVSDRPKRFAPDSLATEPLSAIPSLLGGLLCLGLAPCFPDGVSSPKPRLTLWLLYARSACRWSFWQE